MSETENEKLGKYINDGYEKEKHKSSFSNHFYNIK
jgi:hypothetical protein